MRLYVHRFLPRTKVEGPGIRACIWVQGCPIRCPGCAVPWTWSATGGEEMEIKQLADRILKEPDLEGVTFLGGEPFEQAEGLAQLGRLVKEKGLSVMSFTGYTLEEIQQSSRPGWHDLLQIVDLLIDGPYKEELRDLSRPWVGSANQRYHFLSDRYKHLEGKLNQIPNRLEVRVHPSGRIEVNGMATAEDLNHLFAGMRINHAKGTSN